MSIVNRILNEMSKISFHQRQFVLQLFMTTMICRGKVNYSNLSRYSDYSEKTFRRWFSKGFCFKTFNRLSYKYAELSDELVGAIDCTFLKKSGQKTYGLDSFFSSVSGRSQKGLELSVLALIDVTHRKAYTLSAQQTKPRLSLKTDDSDSRMDFYLKQVQSDHDSFPESVRYIVHDGYYSKSRFLNGICDLGKASIGRLRHDANLRYLYEGPKPVGKGRPKQFDGKVVFDQLSRFQDLGEIEPKIHLYTKVVNSPKWKRSIRIALLLNLKNGFKPSYVLLFSTDTALDARLLIKYYRARFQIEFIFRDAKQFTGLQDCQARNKEALHFHLNSALTTLNLIKIEDQKHETTTFSMASWKARYFNEKLIERFSCISGYDLSSIKKHPRYEELRNFGAIAT